MRLPAVAFARSDFENELPGRAEDKASLSHSRELAFGKLVERHARLMYRVAYSVLRNTQDAEDAVQEAFLKLYRGEAWRQMRDEKAFLARTVWRVALDRLPKREERSFEAEEQFASNAASPETSVVRDAQAALLRRMIDAMPEDLRRVLVLSAIEELNSREIAEIVGIAEGTVRTRLMRAKDELKRRFMGRTEARQ
jgi:RNA polymerase sigma-70 factor, ECF subfamily